MKHNIYLSFLVVFLSSMLYTTLYSQTGPGGIGNLDGTDGQPANVLWLDANQLSLSDGESVSTWTDISGNTHHATQSDATRPTYHSTAMNGKPTLQFDGSQYMVIGEPTDLDFQPGSEEFSVIAVFNSTGDGTIFSKAYSATDQRQYQFFTWTSGYLYTRIGGTQAENTSSVLNTDQIAVFSISTSEINAWVNGTQEITSGSIGASSNNVDVMVGARRENSGNTGSSFIFNGDIAEIIIFDTDLNDAQRIIIENYLSAKYGLTIANDFYSNTIFTYDLIGIGTTDGTTAQTHSKTSGTGGGMLLEEANGTLNNANEFVFAGHDNTVHNATTSDVIEAERARWSRIWRIEKNTSDQIDIKIKFNTEEAGFGTPTDEDDYVLLYRSATTGNFSEVTSSKTIDADNNIVFTVTDANFDEGYYTLGVPEYKEWYTMISGDWDNWEIWTLDPSGALSNNPNKLTPATSPTAALDRVHILSGKTVSISTNERSNTTLEVNGRLDIGTTSGHQFNFIRGSGRIIIETDNFPQGDATHFITQGQGEGTVVFSGSGFTLNKSSTFFNIEVNLDADTDEMLLLTDYTINGDLKIENGIFKINDNSETDVLNLTVAQDVTVYENGSLTVGTGNVYGANSQYHQFIVQGDFTNNGAVKLTNRSAPDYENYDTGGAVELIFNHATQNQKFLCNGTTILNQLTVNKGNDRTYILEVNATATDNFKLYGRSDQEVTGDAGDRDGNKALRLLAGTLKLGSNIVIPVLSYDYSFDIDNDACLWLNGANVTMPYGKAVVRDEDCMFIYGRLRITGNSVFTEETVYGTLLREQGSFVIESGTANLNAFRTSTYEHLGDHIGAYIQSGGTVNVISASDNDDYASFHLPYKTNVFQMSGGTLTIENQQNGGDANDFAIITNCAEGNYNVTGGTVILDMYEDDIYKMTSTAPFWNFIIRNSVDDAQTLTISDFDENSGGDVPDVAGQPLVVLNDFTIENKCTFVANGNDVKIGGDFDFEEGAEYTHGNNTTWFIQDFQSTLKVNDNTTTHDLKLYNVTIYKDQRHNPELFYSVNFNSSGRSADKPGILIEGDLLIQRGELDLNQWEVDIYGDIEIVDGQITADETTPGKLVINGTSAQTIKGAIGAEQSFGALEVDKTNSTPSTNTYLTFLSDINVDEFILTNGIANLDSYNLDVDVSITGSGYSSSKMFRTAGNASDGGLTLPVSLSGSYSDELILLFPVGTEAEYNHAEIYCNATSLTTSGTMTVRPVNDYHPSNTDQDKTIPYYWNVSYSGLESISTTDLQYTFYYYGDASPNENKGAMLNYDDYTWSQYNKNDDNGDVVVLPTIEFPSEAFITGDFTVGNQSVFNQPEIYYSRLVSQDYGINSMPQWSDKDTWSLESHTGDPGNGNNAYPQDGDIAIIGYGGTGGGDGGNRHHVAYRASDNYKLAKVIIDASEESGVWDSRLFIEQGATIDVGVMEGDGTLELRLDPNNQTTLNGDFGNFVNNYDEGARVTFRGEAETEIEMPYMSNRLPNVRIEGNGNRTFYFSDEILILSDLTVDHYATLRIEYDLTINDDFKLGGYNEGKLEFPHDVARTVTVIDDFKLTADNDSEVSVDNSSENNLEHKFIIGGDIELNRGSKFDLFSNNSGGNNVILEIFGETDTEMNNLDDMPVELYRLNINKLQGKNFTIDRDPTTTNNLSNFSINGPTDGDEKAIELISGNLILDNGGIDVTLTSGGADFKIPSEASLQVKNGTARASGDNTGIWLDGQLTAGFGSTWYLNEGNNNYIEYTASGNAEIAIYQADFYVGSQIRRPTNTEEGILNFKHEHDNSTVIIGTDGGNIPENNRAVFEILNTGSNFYQCANSKIIIANAQDNPEIASLYLAPETYTGESGATIQIGDANTFGNQEIGIYSTVDLINLQTDNSSGENPSAKMWTIPLTLQGTLTIGGSTTFDANGLNLTLQSDFTNNGTFTSNQNTTYFTGSATQELTGETTFYNFQKTNSNLLNLNDNISIENELHLLDGTLADNDNDITLLGNAFIDGIHTSGANCDGIIFAGTQQQELQTTGEIGTMTLQNPEGLLIPTQVAPITINTKLQLCNGVIDIGENLLTLTQDAEIVEKSAFCETNMIQTNISLTDKGVKKIFPAIATNTSFVFPIGSQGKYTPIELVNFSEMNAGGSIRVKAADERQSTITDDTEACDQIDDLQNVLQYHWIVDADNVTNITVDLHMTYYDEDVSVTAPHTKDDYIAAKLNTNSDDWIRGQTTDFDQTTNKVKFSYSDTDGDEVDGEFTAGVGATCNSGANNGAIPEEVATYISVQDGNWNQASTWETYPDGDPGPAGGPQGAIVFVEHDVSVTQNYRAVYKTNVNSSGVLNIAKTFGHRLGYVYGTGKLYLERGDMPAAVYDDFFASTGGTVEFGGTDNYDILSEILQINHLTLSGSGERRLPNTELVIAGNLTIDGADFINEHDEKLTVRENIYFNTGTFDSGMGANAVVVMAGSDVQNIFGDFTSGNAFNHLEIDNALGVNLQNTCEVDEQLFLTAGRIRTDETRLLKLTNTSPSIVTRLSGSFVDGPLSKNITANDNFTFPVGDNNRYGEVKLTSKNASGSDYWINEYFESNPLDYGYSPNNYNSPLQTVSQTEFWEITGPSGGSADVTIRWDAESDISPLYTDISNMRIAEWLSSAWDDVGDNTTGNATSGTVTTSPAVDLDNHVFTLAVADVIENSLQWNGSVSTNWNDPDNWTPNNVPTMHTDVVITADPANQPIVDGVHAKCRALSIAYDASLTVEPPYSIYAYGNTTINHGQLLLKTNTASQTGSLLDNGSITTLDGGKITVQKLMNSENYHYLASPVNEGDVTSEIVTNSLPPWFNGNIISFNEAHNTDDWMNGWSEPLSGTDAPFNWEVGKGYACYFGHSPTLSFEGTTNTGTTGVTVTHTDCAEAEANEGWNFIGNPYPSSLDALEFLIANPEIEGFLRFWDEGSDDYQTGDYADWNAAGATSGAGGTSPNGYISTCQGFFVRKPTSGSAQIEFTNAMRTSDAAQFFKKRSSEHIQRIRLSVVNPENEFNDILIAFTKYATDNYDRMFDAKKTKGNPNLALYTKLNNEAYAIQSYEPKVKDFQVPVFLDAGFSGEYTFRLEDVDNFNDGTQIFIEDKTENRMFNLTTRETYTADVLQGDGINRFILHFNKAPRATRWIGSLSNDWHLAANWSNGIPTEHTTAIIPDITNYPVVSNSASCKNLDIEPGGKLWIQKTASVFVNGNFTLRADANRTAEILDKGILTVLGITTTEKILSPESPDIISSPVVKNHLYTYERLRVNEYDVNTATWIEFNKNNLHPLKGYALFNSPQDALVFDGALNKQDYSGSLSNNGKGFNLLGNPYPATIDWHLIARQLPAGTDQSLYVWNGNNFAYYNPITRISLNKAERYIPPATAFFIRTNTTDDLQMSADARTLEREKATTGDIAYPALQLGLYTKTETTLKDETLIFASQEATMQYDTRFDAMKLQGLNAQYPQIYTLDSNSENDYAMQAIPQPVETVTLPLIVDATSGEYLLKTTRNSFDSNKVKVYLEDTDKQTSELLTAGIEITLNLTGTENNRFYIHLVPQRVTKTAQNPSEQKTEPNIFSHRKDVYVDIPTTEFTESQQQADVFVYNTTGKMVKQTKAVIGRLNKFKLKITGVYMIKVIHPQNGKVMVRKVFVE